MSSPRPDGLTLKEALLRMLEKAISYDVILLVGRSGQEVRCQSFMLSARSDVFQAMLESPRVGAETERDGEGRAIVPMPDVDKESVTCFIRYTQHMSYLYTVYTFKNSFLFLIIKN